ncbi:MAG: beta-propeller fold lactonase family protein [Gemmatimonadaceae bacterium]|nr:beta-propeller fold lactonase family protein [Gemmatimonadaceae bacterium]
MTARTLLAGALLASTPLYAQPTTQPVLVLLKSNASAAQLSPSGAVEFSLPTGVGPHEVVVGPDGRTAVVADYGAREPGRSLTVLDLVDRRVVRTIDLGEYRRPHGLAWLPGSRRVLVTCETNQVVLVVAVDEGRVESAIGTNARGTHMVVVSKDGRTAWTSNIGGSVSRLNLVSRTLEKTAPIGAGPEAIDVSPDGRELWVGDRQLNRVTILDAVTLDSLASLPTGEFPNRAKMTPDGRTVLISNARSGTIAVYDRQQRVRLPDIVIPFDASRVKDQLLGTQMGASPVPLGILMHPAGQRAWVALAATDQIAELDVTARRVARLINTGREPDGMALVMPTYADDDTSFAAVQARGAVVMGVDQSTSTHRFESRADGGRIVLQRDSADAEGTARIRAHLRDIATRFRRGDFTLPGVVHGETVPGTAVMAARRASIRYAVDTLPRGGMVTIVTRDAKARAAIHEFLDYQRRDHRTMDHSMHHGRPEGR